MSTPPRPAGRRARAVLLAPSLVTALAAWCLAGASLAADRYDPALRFRTKTTAHFVVYYHTGEELLARRLAVIAEQVHKDLVARMGSSPAGPTHLILVDQHDIANGFATTHPVNTIEVAAVWPPGGSFIGNTDDWLRLVMTHEYAHVVHLDRSGGWARGLRRVFGRAPFAMPNQFAPEWQIEGIATFMESASAGRGRLHSQGFMDLVDLQAAAGKTMPIDGASGGLVRWPGGHTSYAFGAGFYDYLVRRFGEAPVSEYHRRAAGSFYFTSSRHARPVFGESIHTLWKSFLAERGKRSPWSPVSGSPGRRLTRHGYVVDAPRFVRRLAPATEGSPASTRAGDQAEIVYVATDSDRFPAMYAVAADGSSASRRLRDQYQTSGLAPVGDIVVFDQIELARNVALRADLYLLDRSTGVTWRLSSGARLIEPDLSPDGRFVVAVQLVDGRRRLVAYRLERDPAGSARLSGDPLFVIGEAGDQFSSPRWSPDGGSIAVSRQRLLGPADLVIVESPGFEPRAILSGPGCQVVTPSWLPDSRTVLVSSDCAGGGFSLYALDIGERNAPAASPTVHLALSVPGGARSPDVSSDGRWLVYVGATAEGADLYVTAADRGAWPRTDVFSRVGDDHPSDPDPQGGAGTAIDPPYSPWSTVLPRWWYPTFDVDDGQVKIGAGVMGSDVLGYHRYDATVMWWAGRGRCSTCAGATPADWAVGYTYNRWSPTLFATSTRRSRIIEAGEPSAESTSGDRREDAWTAGLIVRRARVRSRTALVASLALERVTVETERLRWTQQRPSLRLGWSLATARRYGYSVSPENGVALAVTSEHLRPELGADAAAGAATAEFRGYLGFGQSHWVLATRLAAGSSWGDAWLRRRFVVGGSGSTPVPGGYGSDALDLIRGTGAVLRAGSNVTVSNVDLRFPAARIERGVGLVPVFVRTLHAAVFLDAGHAWDRNWSSRDIVVSAGVEASVDAVVGFGWPITATAGVCWVRKDAVVGWSRRPAAFARLGYAF